MLLFIVQHIVLIQRPGSFQLRIGRLELFWTGDPTARNAKAVREPRFRRESNYAIIQQRANKNIHQTTRWSLLIPDFPP